MGVKVEQVQPKILLKSEFVFKKSTNPQASRSGIHALVHAPVTVRYIATDLILPATQLTDDISLEKQVAFNLTVDATLSAGWRFY